MMSMTSVTMSAIITPTERVISKSVSIQNLPAIFTFL